MDTPTRHFHPAAGTRTTRASSAPLRVVTLTVNGQPYSKAVATTTTLLDYLRDELDLTGSKKGCDAGECGCCAVLLDGKPINSCLLLAVEAEGRAVTTIEGIAQGEQLHPVQQAMVEEGAVQCGYCTPAMVINGVAMLADNPNPSDTEVKACVSNTICRCTGYTKIETAMKAAAQALREGK